MIDRIIEFSAHNRFLVELCATSPLRRGGVGRWRRGALDGKDRHL